MRLQVADLTQNQLKQQRDLMIRKQRSVFIYAYLLTLQTTCMHLYEVIHNASRYRNVNAGFQKHLHCLQNVILKK